MKQRVLVVLSFLLLLPTPTSNASDANPTCTRAGAIRLLREFVSEYNAGDTDRLDQMFAPLRDFGWYRVFIEREQPLARNRSTLMSYFVERHDKQDEFSKLRLDVNSRPDHEGKYGFGFRLFRATADPHPLAEGPFEGKGGADCRYIYAWQMGPEI